MSELNMCKHKKKLYTPLLLLVQIRISALRQDQGLADHHSRSPLCPINWRSNMILRMWLAEIWRSLIFYKEAETMCVYIVISDVFCYICVVLQLLFGFMEMFKWHGMATKVFKRSKEEAIATASLAANVITGLNCLSCILQQWHAFSWEQWSQHEDFCFLNLTLHGIPRFFLHD